MDKIRKSLQMNQPGVEPMPEGSGWPEPLTDPSDPIKFGMTDGKSPSTKTKKVDAHAKEVGESNASVEYYD